MRIEDATVVCSRLLPLASLLRGSLRLHLPYLCSWLALGLLTETPLPFRGFWAVPPGGVVTLGPGGLEQSEVATGIRWVPTQEGSNDELARRLRCEVSAAVARTTRGARKVAVAVSGGIDSSLLLATAMRREREQNGATVLPVTMVYGGPGDDRPYMRALAQRLNVVPIEARPRDGAGIAGACRIVDGQLHTAAPAEIALVALQKARAAGAQVALSGESAEWLFDASSSVLASFICASPLLALRVLSSFEHIDPDFARPVASILFRSSLPTLSRWLRSMRKRQAPGVLASWAGPRLRAFARSALRTEQPAILDQRQRVRAAALSPYLAQASETRARWERLSGLRMRMPYLDADLVDFAASLPLQSLFAGDRERGLMREAMRGEVPESLRTRMTKSRPDDANVEAYEGAGAYSSIRHLADVHELSAMGLVDRARFKEALERFAAEPGAAGTEWYTLWRVLVAEEYVRWFRDLNGGAITAPR